MTNVFIIGRLGADCVERTNKNGGTYLTFPFASDDYVNGERTTSWFNVSLIGERWVRMKQYLTKGKLIVIHGQETVRLYTDKNGEVRIGRDILADRFDFPPISQPEQEKEKQTTEATVTVQAVASESPKAAEEPKAEPAKVVTNTAYDDLPF